MNKQKKPLVDPPIFAILEPKRMAISRCGSNAARGNSRTAPGNLHFVTCATEKQVRHPNLSLLKDRLWRRDPLDQTRPLRLAHTSLLLPGRKIKPEETFRGSSPDTCPQRHTFFSTTDYFYGSKPTPEPIIDWLASLLE